MKHLNFIPSWMGERIQETKPSRGEEPRMETLEIQRHQSNGFWISLGCGDTRGRHFSKGLESGCPGCKKMQHPMDGPSSAVLPGDGNGNVTARFIPCFQGPQSLICYS